MKSLVIFGAGGLGREVLNLLKDVQAAQPEPAIAFRGWIDPHLSGNIAGYPVLGDDAWALRHLSSDTEYLLAFGSPVIKRKLDQHLTQQGLRAHSLVHPLASVGARSTLAPGTLICAGARITVDVHIGRHVLINLNATIGHDCEIGDYSSIQPGVHLSGGCHVHPSCQLNTGAVILPQLEIGANAIIGAGAVVTRSCQPNNTYVGVPARPLALPGKGEEAIV